MPQHGDEPPEEDDRHTVPGEQVAPRLEPRAVQADVMSVALGQTLAAGLADPVPGVVAEDGRGGRGGGQGGDVEAVRCPGIRPRR